MNFTLFIITFALCPGSMLLWAMTSYPANKIEKRINQISFILFLVTFITLIIGVFIEYNN